MRCREDSNVCALTVSSAEPHHGCESRRGTLDQTDNPVLGCRSENCHLHLPRENDDGNQRSDFSESQPMKPPHPRPEQSPPPVPPWRILSTSHPHTGSQAVEEKFFPRKYIQGSCWLHYVEGTPGASHDIQSWVQNQSVDHFKFPNVMSPMYL